MENRAEESTAVDVSGEPQQKAKTRKPSKSAVNKKKDAHNAHINKGASKEEEAKMRGKYMSSDTLEAFLQQFRLSLDTHVRPVTVEFEPTIHEPTIQKLCSETVRYLYAVGEISQDGQNGNSDADMLAKVVKIQALTKIHCARRVNGFFDNAESLEYHNRVKSRLQALPKVLNQYVANIGAFKFDGQTFIPKSADYIQFETLGAGAYPTGSTKRGDEGGDLMCVATVQQQHLAAYVSDGKFRGDEVEMVRNGHGTVTWVRKTTLGSFNGLTAQYADFINRCSKEAANIMEFVVYDTGSGTAAQLVASKDYDKSHQREAWCCRKIDTGVFDVGALFSYGFENKSKLYDPDIACITGFVDIAGMYTSIQRTQKL